jgi:hypothetical protein
MSNLIGRNFRFIHTPKTGGSWVANLLSVWLKLPVIFDDRFGGHATLSDALGDGLPTLVFVRNPWSWYESFYRERHHISWRRPPGDAGLPIEECGGLGATFDQFMAGVLDRHPGWLVGMFDDFTSFRQPRPEITIGLWRNLGQTVDEFLMKQGIEFDRELLYSHVPIPVNATRCRCGMVDTPWTDELVEGVQRTHRDIFEAFGYEDKPPIC